MAVQSGGETPREPVRGAMRSDSSRSETSPAAGAPRPPAAPVERGADRPTPAVASTAAAPTTGSNSTALSSAYRTSAGLDPPPRPLDDINPDFPGSAGTRGGSVVLRLLISETGAIDKIEVVRASPPGLFEESALAAFGSARFAPGYLAGTPVKSQIMFEVEFAPQSRNSPASSRGY